MPALRHSQHIQSDVHYDLTAPICTCPTDSPLPDRTPPIAKSPEKKRVRSRRVKNQDHIPRPRNAFIIFRSHYINFLKSNHPTLPACPDQPSSQKNIENKASQPSSSEFQQNQLSKIAAKVWNGMAPDERKPYSEEANREKEWHKKMYPDYVYRAPSANNTTLTETKDKTKTKNFKIKVKMGDPSLKKRRARAPSPELSSSAFYEGDMVGLGVARDRQYLLGTHVAGTEHDEFVPTECIPPLDLSSSCSIEQEAVVNLKFKGLCPPLQPTYAVDLSPRSLAYERYQAKVYPDLVDPLTDLHLGYEYAEPSGGGAGFEQVILPATTAASSSSSSSSEGEDEGSIQLIDTSFPNVLPYLSSSSSSSSSSVSSSSSSTSSTSSTSSSFVPGSERFYPNFDLGLFSLTSGENFQVVQVQAPGGDHDGFGLGLDMDLDVPEFNFEMGDGGRELLLLGDSESLLDGGRSEAAMMKAMEMEMANGGEDEMGRGLAAWAGYE